MFITTTFSENLPVDVDVPPVAVAVLPVAVTTSVMLFPPFVRANIHNGFIKINSNSISCQQANIPNGRYSINDEDRLVV